MSTVPPMRLMSPLERFAHHDPDVNWRHGDADPAVDAIAAALDEVRGRYREERNRVIRQIDEIRRELDKMRRAHRPLRRLLRIVDGPLAPTRPQTTPGPRPHSAPYGRRPQSHRARPV